LLKKETFFSAVLKTAGLMEEIITGCTHSGQFPCGQQEKNNLAGMKPLLFPESGMKCLMWVSLYASSMPFSKV